MDMETIKRGIEKLPREDKSILLTEVMPALCRELLGDEACRDRMKEVFGIDCVEELDKRFEMAV
jgi:hypothetical protein